MCQFQQEWHYCRCIRPPKLNSLLSVTRPHAYLGSRPKFSLFMMDHVSLHVHFQYTSWSMQIDPRASCMQASQELLEDFGLSSKAPALLLVQKTSLYKLSAKQWTFCKSAACVDIFLWNFMSANKWQPLTPSKVYLQIKKKHAKSVFFIGFQICSFTFNYRYL